MLAMDSRGCEKRLHGSVLLQAVGLRGYKTFSAILFNPTEKLQCCCHFRCCFILNQNLSLANILKLLASPNQLLPSLDFLLA
jgi:hypothetical protein